jgi:hypothetical protein
LPRFLPDRTRTRRRKVLGAPKQRQITKKLPEEILNKVIEHFFTGASAGGPIPTAGCNTKPAELYEQYQRFAARFRFSTLNLIKFGKQSRNLGI